MTSLQASFDFYKDIPGYKAILKAVFKNVIQILVQQLSEQTGEESVLLTASITDGTLSHLGSETGRYFLEGHDEIKSQFLGFCLKRHHKRKSQDTLQIPQPKRFASSTHSLPDYSTFTSESDMYLTSHSPGLSGHSPGLSGHSSGFSGHGSGFESPVVHPVSLAKVKRKQQAPLHRSKLAGESLSIGSDKESLNDSLDNMRETGIDMTLSNRVQTQKAPTDKGDGVDRDNISVSTSQIDSNIVSDVQIRIKTESTDYDEGSTNIGSEKVNTEKGMGMEKGIERSEETTDEAVNDSAAENSVASIKIEALDDDDLEITGLEGEMSNTSGSFGVVDPGFSDGQIYAQNMSGVEGQGQRTNTEGQQFRSEDSTTTTTNATTSQQNSEDRPFQCPDCPKTFKVRRHLQVHYRIHSGVRPYECKECGLTFNQQGPLQTHRRRHTGERPYQCDICKDRFMRKDSMLAHKRKHFTLRTLLENKFPKHLK